MGTATGGGQGGHVPRNKNVKGIYTSADKEVMQFCKGDAHLDEGGINLQKGEVNLNVGVKSSSGSQINAEGGRIKIKGSRKILKWSRSSSQGSLPC